jgi:hypothetical protein
LPGEELARGEENSMKKLTYLLISFLLLFFAACSSNATAPDATMPVAETPISELPEPVEEIEQVETPINEEVVEDLPEPTIPATEIPVDSSSEDTMIEGQNVEEPTEASESEVVSEPPFTLENNTLTFNGEAIIELSQKQIDNSENADGEFDPTLWRWGNDAHTTLVLTYDINGTPYDLVEFVAAGEAGELITTQEFLMQKLTHECGGFGKIVANMNGPTLVSATAEITNPDACIATNDGVSYVFDGPFAYHVLNRFAYATAYGMNTTNVLDAEGNPMPYPLPIGISADEVFASIVDPENPNTLRTMTIPFIMPDAGNDSPTINGEVRMLTFNPNLPIIVQGWLPDTEVNDNTNANALSKLSSELNLHFGGHATLGGLSLHVNNTDQLTLGILFGRDFSVVNSNGVVNIISGETSTAEYEIGNYVGNGVSKFLLSVMNGGRNWDTALNSQSGKDMNWTSMQNRTDAVPLN